MTRLIRSRESVRLLHEGGTEAVWHPLLLHTPATLQLIFNLANPTPPPFHLPSPPLSPLLLLLIPPILANMAMHDMSTLSPLPCSSHTVYTQ